MLLREKRLDSFPEYSIISNFIRVNILVKSPLFLSEKPNTKISIAFVFIFIGDTRVPKILFRMRDLVLYRIHVP